MIEVREGTISEIVALSRKIPEFHNPYGEDDYLKRFNNIPHLILVAEENSKIIGFKCGYHKEPDSSRFYSWMGGVLPDNRKKGVAKVLLEAMEEWCRSEGFDILEFKTLNQHKSMLIFGIRNGFNITNVVQSPKDSRPRILLEKELIQ